MDLMPEDLNTEPTAWQKIKATMFDQEDINNAHQVLNDEVNHLPGNTLDQKIANHPDRIQLDQKLVKDPIQKLQQNLQAQDIAREIAGQPSAQEVADEITGAQPTPAEQETTSRLGTTWRAWRDHFAAENDTPKSAAIQLLPDLIGSGLHNLWTGLKGSFYTITVPEQAAARAIGTNLFEQQKWITPQESQDLLSRDELHWSDLVNMAWKISGEQTQNPDLHDQLTMPLGKTARGATSFAANIIGDPLSFLTLGFGQATKAGNIAKSLPNLAEISSREALVNDFVVQAKNILTDTGHLEALNDFQKGNLGHSEFIKLVKDTGAAPETLTELKLLAEDTLYSKKSVTQEIRDDEKSLIIVDIGIPFTNLQVRLVDKQFMGIPLSGDGAAKVYESISSIPGYMAKTIDQAANKVINAPIIAGGQHFPTISPAESTLNAIGDFVAGIRTKTPYAIYDAEQVKFYGEVSNSTRVINKKYEDLAGMAKEANINQAGYARIIEEVERRGEMIGLKNQSPEWIKKDVERRAIMQPAEVKIADEIEHDMNFWLKSAQDRGMPMSSLGGQEQGGPLGYLPHFISQEWINEYKGAMQASNKLGRQLEATFPGYDRSNLGRKNQLYLNDINEFGRKSSEAELGKAINPLIDNPLTLARMRSQQISGQIAAHDFLQNVKGYIANSQEEALQRFGPYGFTPFDVNEWMARTAKSELPGQVPDYAVMLPGEYWKQGSVYLPTQVAVRLEGLLKPNTLDGMKAVAANSWFAFNHIFKNNILFGMGYYGKQVLSNTWTYMAAGGNPGSLAETTAMLLPRLGSKEKFAPMSEMMVNLADGTQVLMGKDQIVNLMYRNGIIGTSIEKDISSWGLAENIGDLYSQRAKINKGVQTAADIATLWTVNKHLVSISEDLPKAALFFDRLKKGYTPEAAAESIEYWFYNFSNPSPVTKQLRQLMPFVQHPIKTLEQSLDLLQKGSYRYLEMPKHVNDVLQGMYVENPDVIQGLQQNLPGYTEKILDPVHGPVWPGAREVSMQIPWSIQTLDTLLNPTNSINPAIKVAAMAVMGKLMPGQNDQEIFANKDRLHQELARAVDAYVPVTAKYALLASGGFFPNAPGVQAMRSLYDVPNPVTAGNAAIRYNDAAQFGESMRKNLGLDWLYKFYFGKQYSDNTISMMNQDAQIGEAIRQHFRNLTAGVMSLDKIDTTFLFNDAALKRQAMSKNKEIKDISYDMGMLMARDPEQMTTQELTNMYNSTRINAIAELISLKQKEAAGVQYYNWYLLTRKQNPELLKSIFGIGSYNMDYDSIRPKPQTAQDIKQKYLNILKPTNDQMSHHGQTPEELAQEIMGK